MRTGILQRESGSYSKRFGPWCVFLDFRATRARSKLGSYRPGFATMLESRKENWSTELIESLAAASVDDYL
jgi:hypothetical protein